MRDRILNVELYEFDVRYIDHMYTRIYFERIYFHVYALTRECVRARIREILIV